MFPNFPKNRGEVDQLSESILPLFDARAVTRETLSAGLNITSNAFDSGLSGGPMSVVRASGLFVASSAGGNANVATSVDGQDNWVLRALPSSKQWRVGADGNNLLAVSTNSVDTAKSVDGGVTWTASGNMPAAADNGGDNIPVNVGGRWIVLSSSVSTQCFASTDLGATWSTQTLPSANGLGHFFKVGVNYWYWVSSLTAQYSPTGLTGSWTGSGIGATPIAGNIWQNPGEDAVYLFQVGAANFILKTTDGVAWVSTGVKPLLQAGPTYFINGVHVAYASDTDNSFLRHGDRITPFWSEKGVLTSNRAATDGIGTFITCHGVALNVITSTANYGAFR